MEKGNFVDQFLFFVGLEICIFAFRLQRKEKKKIPFIFLW